MTDAEPLLHAEAVAKPLPKSSTFAAGTRAAYLMDSLRDYLLKTREEEEILKGGFTVNLALDLEENFLVRCIALRPRCELGTREPQHCSRSGPRRPSDVSILLQFSP